MTALLLVEGKSDEHVIYALAMARALPKTFKVKDMQGIEPLLESLPVRLKAESEDYLGIVIDADIDVRSRWQSVKTRLAGAGIEAPDSPPAEGLVLDLDEGRRVGVWIMPNNGLTGNLETFLQTLAPESNALWTKTQTFIDGIPHEMRAFPTKDESKALIHAWLAVQEEPGKPLGQALTAKYLDPMSESANVFTEWLRRLFN